MIVDVETISSADAVKHDYEIFISLFLLLFMLYIYVVKVKRIFTEDPFIIFGIIKRDCLRESPNIAFEYLIKVVLTCFDTVFLNASLIYITVKLKSINRTH